MTRSTASAFNSMDRRSFLQGSSAFAGVGAMGLSGCVARSG
jgi:hypothetical protein